jgi:steroid delta-isomerase-like uncharacterized protein
MSTAATIHREIANLWNQRDWSGLRNVLHSGYSYTSGLGKEMTGEAMLNIAMMFSIAFPDAKLEVKQVYTQGDVAIAEMVSRGTHQGELLGVAATGKPVELLLCNVIELRDGKVYREREYMDMLTVMTEIGVVKAPALQQAGLGYGG